MKAANERNMVTFQEFWKTRKERREKLGTIIVVVGIKLMVIIYDVCSKTSHDILFSVRNPFFAEGVSLRIPEIHIKERKTFNHMVQEFTNLV